MNAKQKYLNFLESLVSYTKQQKLIESVITAHNIIFENEYEEELSIDPRESIGKKRAAQGHWEGSGLMKDVDVGQSKFTQAHEKGFDVKSKARESQELGWALPSATEVNSLGDFFIEMGLPENITNKLTDLISKTSQNQIDAIAEYIDHSFTTHGDDLRGAVADIMEDLQDKAQFANEKRARLSQAGEEHYGYETSDVDSEFGNLFARGWTMDDIIAEEGSARIDNDARSKKLPPSFVQAAVSAGLSKEQIKELDKKHSEVITIINKAIGAFKNYIWSKMQNRISGVNNAIIKQLAEHNKAMQSRILKEYGRNPDKANELLAQLPQWPYAGKAGLYQKLLADVRAGGSPEVQKALSAIGTTPEEVLNQIVNGVFSPELAVSVLQSFVKEQRSKLAGQPEDSSPMIALRALISNNSDATNIYNTMLNKLTTESQGK